eukprot:UN3880
MRMMRRHKYVDMLKDVFGGSEWVTLSQYHAQESNSEVRAFLILLRIERSQARRLFQVLSAHGSHAVELTGFVIGCINMKRAVNPLDLMEMEMMSSGFIEEQTHAVMACLDRSGTLRSLPNKMNIRDLVTRVTPDVFAQSLVELARVAARDFHFDEQGSSIEQFADTVQRVAELALATEGGCGFVVAPGEAFRWLQEVHTVDFQVVDRSEAFPGGYMTERLREVHVSDE